MERVGLSYMQGLGVASVPALCLMAGAPGRWEAHGVEGTKGDAASAAA